MNGSRQPLPPDPLREVRILKRIVQIGVYLGIAGYLVPFRVLLDMSTPQLMGPLIAGLIIATVAIEGAFWQMFRLRKQSAYPHLIALQLNAVSDLAHASNLALRLTSHYLKSEAALLIWRDENDRLVPIARYGIPGDSARSFSPPREHHGPVRDVVETRRVVIGRPSQCPSWSGLFGDEHTVAYIPLTFMDRVAAILVLVGPRRSADLKDRKLLESVGLVMGLSLENTRLNQRRYESVMQVLCCALDMRDSATQGHSQRVARLAGLVARQIGLPGGEVKKIEQAAALHDIGKIGVADAILSKPGPLTDPEWDDMRRHPSLGYQMLGEIEGLREVAEIVYSHHERYDGTGYPRGLAGEAIPVGARIFAVVDTYDAITSHRPYRQARSHEDAVEELLRNVVNQFDPAVVRAFVDLASAGLIRPESPHDGQVTANAEPQPVSLPPAG